MVKKLKAQIAAAEGAPKGVGRLLLDICKKEPAAAEIVEQDLDNPDMDITNCYIKMQEAAKAKQKAGCYCMPPEEAEAIIREFYGLPAAQKGQAAAPEQAAGILDLADLMEM